MSSPLVCRVQVLKLTLAIPMAVAASLFISAHVLATPVTVTSSAISQGYTTTSSAISAGTIVSLSSANAAAVVPASPASASKMVGVAATKPLLELSGTDSDVQIVVSGSTFALVSDVNGAINAGDKITASPLEGVGMKASSGAEVVGTAQKNLKDVHTVTQHITGKNGHTENVNVGMLPITVNVVYFASGTSQSVVASLIPPFLQSIANSLTGHQVSSLRVLLGTLALLAGFAAITIMLYVSIRNGVVSLGRNPLAETALRRGLVDVIIAALGVLALTVALVYGVLLT